MEKWPVAFILLVALLQVPDVLSRSSSAGQAADLAPNTATAEEKALPGFQAPLKGLFSWST